MQNQQWYARASLIHSTRISVPIPHSHCQAVFLERVQGDADAFRHQLTELDTNKLSLFKQIPAFLPEWDPTKHDDFEGTWWKQGSDEASEFDSINATTMERWSRVYFQVGFTLSALADVLY